MRAALLMGIAAAFAAGGGLLAYGCGGTTSVTANDAGSSDSSPLDAAADSGLAAARAKIQHLIIINQENRSFDHYFGTFPGADGIPMDGGIPTVCSPTPSGGCEPPFHDPRDENTGGPHGATSSTMCVADGGMNGF